MEHLFAYGTLMCEDIMLEVSGCRLPSVPGTLQGYCRRGVKGEHYPAIVPDSGGRVEGVVYLNLTPGAWRRLDGFEGELYSRELVRVGLEDGTSLLAAAYVLRPEFLDHLEQSGWDFADFLSHGKATFQKRYKGYHAL
ncbi:MAG: gamma-glutamylcyclotransferase [Deltaproteobacteria bacterium]|nr:gamma-glutamylcyclotransferase [Deltaproteobacteria bacterium]